MKFLFYFLIVSVLYSQNVPNFESHRNSISSALSEIKRLYNKGLSFAPDQSDSSYYYGNLLLKMNSDKNIDSSKAMGNYLVAKSYFSKNNFDSSVHYFKKAINSVGDIDKMGEFYISAKNLLAMSYMRKRDPVNAKNVFEQILDEIELTSNSRLISGVYNNLANLSRQIHDYELALKYYEKSIEYSGKSITSILNSYFSIASIYNQLNKYEEADLALNQALKLERIPLHHRIGIYNLKVKNFKDFGIKDSSEYYTSLAYEKASGIKDGDLKYQAFSNMAQLMIDDNKFAQAGKIIEHLSRMKNLFNPSSEINSEYLKIKLLFNQKKYAESIKIGELLIEKAKNTGKEFYLKDTYKILAESYDSLGEISLANSYLKIYSDFLERRRKGDNRRLDAEIKAKYNLTKMGEKIESTNNIARITTVLTILSVLVGIILFVWGLKSYKKYKRAKILSTELEAEKEIHKENYLNLAEKVKRDKIEGDGFIIIDDKRIDLSDIISIKSSGHYLYFNLMSRKKRLLVRNNLKDILSQLPGDKFVQIHRSSIINLIHVKSYSGNEVELVKDEKLKLSRTFKPIFLEAFRTTS